MRQTGEPFHDAHELGNAHVGVLDRSPIQHRGAHAAPFAIRLGTAQNPEDHALFAGEAIARVGNVVEHDGEDSIPAATAAEASVDRQDRHGRGFHGRALDWLTAPHENRR